MGRRASGFDCINTSDQPPDLARVNMVMIRALSDRSNSPTPLTNAMEDSLQLLLKGAAEHEHSVEGVCKRQRLDEEGNAETASVASKVEMALFMADMRTAELPPREIAADLPEENASDVPTACESDGSERGDARVWDEEVASQDASYPEEGGEEGATLQLAFQRGASPCRDFSPSSARETSAPQKRRGVADRASHFYCKHPGCGKAYGCPDAVRKHCRKKHSEWLRRLGHLGPAGYCRWEQSGD